MCNIISTILLLSPCREKHGPLFEWIWISCIQECFVPSLVEIDPMVLRRFLDIFNIILLFRYYLPLGKGTALHLNKIEFLLPMDALYQVWLQLALWFWRRRWKCEKFTDGQTDRQTDGQTDRWTYRRQTDRQRMTGDQKSSLELSAQVS